MNKTNAVAVSIHAVSPALTSEAKSAGDRMLIPKIKLILNNFILSPY